MANHHCTSLSAYDIEHSYRNLVRSLPDTVEWTKEDVTYASDDRFCRFLAKAAGSKSLGVDAETDIACAVEEPERVGIGTRAVRSSCKCLWEVSFFADAAITISRLRGRQGHGDCSRSTSMHYIWKTVLAHQLHGYLLR